MVHIMRVKFDFVVSSTSTFKFLVS